MLRRLCACLARRFAAPSVAIVMQSLFQGGILSVCLATWCLQLTTLLGTSLPVVLALLAALSLAIACGAVPIAASRRLALPGLSSGALLYFALAAWMVASPWLLQCIDWSLAQSGFISLTSSTWNTAVLFALAGVALGFPAFVTAQLAISSDGSNSNGTRTLPFIFLGGAAGLTGWSLGLAQIIGPYHCGILMAGLGLVVAVVRSYRSVEGDPPLAETGASCMASLPVAHAASVEIDDRVPLRPLLAVLLAIACGGWIAALGVLLEQLLPGTVYLPCSEVIGLCLGIAGGSWLISCVHGTTRGLGPIKCWSVCGLAVWGVGVLGAFPLAIRGALGLSAYVSSPTLLLLARGAAAALALVPVGVVSALSLAPAGGAHASRRRLELGTSLVAALLGFTVVFAWGGSRFPLELLVVALAWWTLAAAGLTAMAPGREVFSAWPQRLMACGAAAVVVVAPLWRHNFDPQRSAKLLFNSNVAYAYRTGCDPSLLMSLDDGRWIATTTASGSVYTIWRFGGHQLQIRENGIPVGVVSTNTDAFPRFVPETMQTAFPLVLHEKVERLLLLGLGSSESLTTALSFPVPDVVCLEGNAGLIEIVRQVVAPDLGKNFLEDERVSLALCDPALGMAATSGQFDAIVSSPGHVALARAQPCLTAEFYQRAARKLSAGGIFCQRLSCIDFGPRPLQTIVRTMQHAFRDVLALEVAQGEFLLAATNDSRGLIRPGLISRLELPQMRALCGQSGIDWTVILNLGAFDQHGLAKFTAASSPTPHSAANGRLAFSLPREVIRWGPKLQEVQEALAPARNRLLTWVDDADSPVLVRRLAEVQGQFDLMTKYADQFWAYRASLRSQVKEKPRSRIQLASATDEEKQLHPEDRRRLRYFQALGRAVRSRSAADIERLARFASPYDPLISYFVHQEAAELYALSKERDVLQELRHRQYATFFSSPHDASLRNVFAALRILREHPEAEPDPQVRWDSLNGLLQALKLRWEARTGVRPANVKDVIGEIDDTILATEQTFQLLEALTAEAGIPDSTWTKRRHVLDKTLIRPVKAYQLELIPYLHRRPATAPADANIEPQGDDVLVE